MLLFVLRAILCTLAMVLTYLTVSLFRKNKVAIIATIAVSLSFIVTLIVTNWTDFAIPKIFLFISVVLYIVMEDEEIAKKYFTKYAAICWTATILSFVIVIVSFFCNFKRAEEPKIVTSTHDIVCAKDAEVKEGNISGSGFPVLSIQGEINEKVVYRFYYTLENGGIKFVEVDAEDITLFYLKDGESPYLEKIDTITYQLNYNEKPPKEQVDTIKTVYKLYIPQGSLGTIYEFDMK